MIKCPKQLLNVNIGKVIILILLFSISRLYNKYNCKALFSTKPLQIILHLNFLLITNNILAIKSRLF